MSTPHLPRRLAAPEPGWTTEADVIVVGSGIAGLTAALRLRERVDRVLLVTKPVLSAGSTQWAQGIRAPKCFLRIWMPPKAQRKRCFFSPSNV